MTLPDWLTAWFNSPWLPAILFFGAFADAFIATSLFVLGEIFFIAGGYAVAISGNWWLFPLIWLGALLGDLISYAIGIHYGEKILYKLIRRGKRRRLHYRKAKRIILKKGGMAIFTARLTGPVSKFMPLLAGSMNVPFKTVLIASIWGILLGTLQFLLIGYFLAQGVNYWEMIWDFLNSIFK